MDFLEVKLRADELRKKYLAKPRLSALNVLLYGDIGTGKTSISMTCPKPVHIDSFDPSGTTVRALRPFIERGEILVDDTWEQDSWKKPFAFQKWEEEMEKRIRTGYFNHFGTYMLDSITRFSESCLYRIAQKAGRPGQAYQIQDYNIQQLTIIDWLSQMANLPCHTIITGHIARTHDEVSGAVETGLLLAGKLSEKVSLSFVEKYVARSGIKTATGKEGDRGFRIQTHREGIYNAETRVGGDIFDTFEVPDFKALLTKAGIPAEDKPKLF